VPNHSTGSGLLLLDWIVYQLSLARASTPPISVDIHSRARSLGRRWVIGSLSHPLWSAVTCHRLGPRRLVWDLTPGTACPLAIWNLKH